MNLEENLPTPLNKKISISSNRESTNKLNQQTNVTKKLSSEFNRSNYNLNIVETEKGK